MSAQGPSIVASARLPVLMTGVLHHFGLGRAGVVGFRDRAGPRVHVPDVPRYARRVRDTSEGLCERPVLVGLAGRFRDDQRAYAASTPGDLFQDVWIEP